MFHFGYVFDLEGVAELISGVFSQLGEYSKIMNTGDDITTYIIKTKKYTSSTMKKH